MKKMFTLFFGLVFIAQLAAQTPSKNFNLIATYPYDDDASDIWGYHHQPTNVEYAIVGLNDGTSIISLEIPSVPQEIAYFPGTNSIWRDIKTWENYAYVVNDDGGGLDIIDFSPLPNNPPTKITWRAELPLAQPDSIDNCHNIFIDEFGYLYLGGSNMNNGGVVILDLNTTPLDPTLVGVAPPIYAHDIYVRNNKMYTSDINNGVFSIYDVGNKANIIFQNNQSTPFNYAHNTWLSDDNNFLFTTDELANAPVTSYDVSDPSDIKELDQFRPYETLGEGVIPHNVHVWSNWLVVSYYTDGCILVDATRPENLVEIGNFDSLTPSSTGFFGAWGAYPFLPSGLVLVSDIENGLYVLEPNYVRACYLEGIVKSSSTNNGLSNATVKLLTTNVEERSNFSGNVKTGFADAGAYQAEISHPGHYSQTIDLVLENGEITEFDVTLEARPVYAFSGIVKDEETGEPVAEAIVNIKSEAFGDNLTLTDAQGSFNYNAIVEGSYELVVGKWGYRTQIYDQDVLETGNRDLEIRKGIQDNFSLDLGWTVETNAPQGGWERGAPIEVMAPFGPVTPGADLGNDDIGNSCYVTGNTADLFGGVLINGTTKITSPVFDLSKYGQPEMVFASWMFAFNIGNNMPSSEVIEVTISNGTEEVVLDEIGYPGLGVPLAWNSQFYDLKTVIDLTDQMQVSFEVDASANNRVAEAGIDFFEIMDLDPPNGTKDGFIETATLSAQPNPSNALFNLSYELPADYKQAQIAIYNIIGQELQQFELQARNGNIDFAAPKPGIYLAQIYVDGRVTKSVKLITN